MRGGESDKMGHNLKLKRRDTPKEEDEYEEIEISYRDGAEGMIAWCEDKVYLPIYPMNSEISIWWPMGDLPSEVNPKTGRSYQDIWEFQKGVLHECLKQDDAGQFLFRLIVLCWMRGEGKSILAVLIQMWKFFNWPRQLIALGANSKDQIKLVHFDWIRDLILNSPELLKDVGGYKNVREKEIQLRDSKNRLQSFIRPISTATGIVSNITGYTFSEIFAMKKKDFFTQLDGSIRNVPNAFGVIDSTVSAKKHVLYQLYQGVITGKTKNVYFSYRCSPTGSFEDFTHPHMDQDQLDDYEVKFPFGEFEKYFKNVWSAGARKVFTRPMIEEMSVLGAEGGMFNHPRIKELLDRKEQLIDMRTTLEQKTFNRDKGLGGIGKRIGEVLDVLQPVSNLYALSDQYGQPKSASLDDLILLGQFLDTDWAIIAGTDFGDPYSTASNARSTAIVLAKGLPGSKSDPTMYLRAPTAPNYFYFLLSLTVSPEHNINVIKEGLEYAHEEYLGLDTLCSERYGAWDIGVWCEERTIAFFPIQPTYDRQKEVFKALLEAAKEGRFKFPLKVGIPGSKSDNILTEELEEFDHDIDTKWFGSTEKTERYGIQDDVVYGIGWSMFGGRLLSVDDFRPRLLKTHFGEMAGPTGLLGVYT